MSKVHRIVIIGIGGIADLIARGAVELPNVALVAGSCRTREKGEAFARRHHCQWFDNNEEMLRTIRPDVAIIATPSGAHLEGLQQCAKHGVHVLCEKPLEITTERIGQMIEAAQKAGIVLGGYFPQRFNPAVVAIHQAVGQGRFGSLSVISAMVPWWREDAYYGGGRWQGTAALDGGGALINQAIHYVDLMQWLAGSAVEEVFAYTGKRAHDPARIEVEDTAVAVMRFGNGAMGQILAATSMYPGSLRRLIIAGRDGTAELREDELVRFEFREERAEDASIRARFAGKTGHAGGSSDPLAMDYVKHKLNLADFLEALEAGREPALSGREAGKAVAIIQGCYESARTGKAVRM